MSPAPAVAAPSPAGNVYGPSTGGGVFIRNPDADKPIWQETAFKIMAVVVLIEGMVELLCGFMLYLVNTVGLD